MKYTERSVGGSLCENCPARDDRITEVQLRGSSFRGRFIGLDEEFLVDNILLIVGETTVANIRIANIDQASIEHDAEFIDSGFANNIPYCSKPTYEITPQGLVPFCTAANSVINEFCKVNYKEEE